MIINPIIPIWIMSIICIAAIILVVLDKPLRDKTKNELNNEKTPRQKELVKKYTINVIMKIMIIVLLFLINLRFMTPNGETSAMETDLKVLFVIDTSVSMRALDYKGKERLAGVMNDCCYIIDELSGSKFSLITFGDTAQRTIPFTSDSDMVQSEIRALHTEDDFYAKGSSMNIVKDVLEKTLKDEYENRNDGSRLVVFFISDGEITIENEKLKSFSSVSKYISDGLVLGYGTKQGGKMVSRLYEDEPTSDYYYVYYYDEKYNQIISNNCR